MEETSTVETAPLDVMIEGDAAASLGPEAQAALRRETIRKLDAAQHEIERAGEMLPQLNGPDARDALEQLGAALDAARAAVNVLWWLAPGEPASD